MRAEAIPWACDFHHGLDHTVEKTGLIRISGFVIDFLPPPRADDQATGLELPEMMRNCGTGHVHHSGDIDDAFLAVAEDPEYPEAAFIAKLLEYPGKRGKALLRRKMPNFLLDRLTMIMRQ